MLFGSAGSALLFGSAGSALLFGSAGIDRFCISKAQFGATGLARIEDCAAGETIVVGYTAADGASVISLAPSPMAGAVNVPDDGNVIARVVNTSGALKLRAISVAPITP
jgi:Ca2+-binding RTX toxin-like protein